MNNKGFIIGEGVGNAYKMVRMILKIPVKNIECATFLSKTTIYHIEQGNFRISGTALYALWCYYTFFVDMSQNNILSETMKKIQNELEILRSAGDTITFYGTRKL